MAKSEHPASQPVWERMKRSCLIFALLGIGLTLVPASVAQEIELVADLNQTLTGMGSSSDYWIEAGGLLYFVRREPGADVLWRTDGTAEGTSPLRELGSFVGTRLFGGELPDGRLAFAGREQAFQRGLWISDGTTLGTRPLANLCRLCSLGHENFVPFGDELLFSAEGRIYATDGDELRQVSDLVASSWQVVGDRIFILESGEVWTLWVSGGQPGSEVAVQTLDISLSFSAIRAFLPFGEKLLLVASGLSSGRIEAWIGDEDGLEPFSDIQPPGEGVEFRDAAANDSRAYVAFNQGLWRTDGTMEGSFHLDAVSGNESGRLTFADELLFFVYEDPDLGRELWRSDGTQIGTVLVEDLFPGNSSSHPNRLTAFGDGIFFFAESDGGPGLWHSDGTAPGTREVHGFEQVDGNRFPGKGPLGVLDDRVFFPADASNTGLEPWSSDGTTEGTRLLANLLEDEGSSNPFNLVPRANDVTFLAEGGAPENEIYRVDTSGTIQLLRLSDELFVEMTGSAGDRILLTENDDPRFGPTRVSLLDPETGEAEEIMVVPRVFDRATVGDRLFFTTGAQLSSGGLRTLQELWVTDGTAAGSSLLLEGAWGDGTFPYSQLAWGDRLAFTAMDEEVGNELWLTDGTPIGTRRALDLHPGPSSSTPSLLLATTEQLYLQANVDEDSRHLVLTDGTAAGTSTTALDPLPAGRVWKLNDRLVWLFAPGDGTSELWTSDGTPNGTFSFATFDSVSSITRTGDLIFLAATTSNYGSELWVSDGTAEGTHLVLDIEPGPEGSTPEELTSVDNKVLFIARTAAAGSEPWVSDGTSEGTRPLGDLAPGPRGSHAADFTVLGDRVLFAARRPDVGRELFAVPRSELATPCVASDTILCLNDGRFRVEVEWRDFQDERGPGRVVPRQSRDSGLFYFFSPNNWEMLIKVLDGCQFNDRFWVFAAVTTDVEYTLRVTDVISGESKTYFNPLGVASRALTDTLAFDTCP